MTATELPVGLMWRLLTWLPKPILRRKFPKHRMAELVQFDIHARHDPVTLDLGRPAIFRVSAFIENKSPFHIEMDRASLTLHCAAQQLRVQLLDRMRLAPGQRSDIYISGNVEADQADAIVRSMQLMQPRIDGFIHFNARLENFRKEVSLSGIQPVLVNAVMRQENRPQLEST